MPLYKYVAKNGPNKVIENTIEARDKDDAIQKINQLGYLATQLIEVSGESVLEESKVRSSSSHSSVRIKSRQLTILTRQLASLLKSGVPILQALTTLSDQIEDREVKQVLDHISSEVRDGQSFYATLIRYPRVFSTLYVSMVRAGEGSGNLQKMLFSIAEYRQDQEEAVGKVRSALAYPILMFFTGAGTIAFMLAFVLPRMNRIFSTLGQDLPLPTQIVLALSTLLREWGWLLIIVSGLGIWGIRRSLRFSAQRRMWSLFFLRLPLIGNLVRRINILRFSRALGLLIRSGIPILTALDLSTPVMQNDVLREELKKCHKELEEGGSLGKSLKRSPYFPPFVTNLILVGEESGQLDEVLDEISISYEKDVDEALKVMTTLFEPLMILVMGLAVGFIVIAMLLPVFEMNFMVH